MFFRKKKNIYVGIKKRSHLYDICMLYMSHSKNKTLHTSGSIRCARSNLSVTLWLIARSNCKYIFPIFQNKKLHKYIFFYYLLGGICDNNYQENQTL